MGTRQDRDCCCPCLVLFLSCTTRSNLSRPRLAHAPFHLPAPVTSSTAAAAAHVASSPQPPTVVVGCLQLEGRCNRPQSTQYSPHRNAVQPSTVCAAQRRAQERPSNRRNEREKEKKKEAAVTLFPLHRRRRAWRKPPKRGKAAPLAANGDSSRLLPSQTEFPAGGQFHSRARIDVRAFVGWPPEFCAQPDWPASQRAEDRVDEVDEWVATETQWPHCPSGGSLGCGSLLCLAAAVPGACAGALHEQAAC